MTDKFSRAALGGAVHHALLATAVLSTTALPAGLAHAQSATDAGETVATDQQESSDHSIGTRVTGQTLLVIDREQILAQGLSSIGDVIQNLPMHGSAANTTFAGPITGETRVSLRNLGSHRALVLVNGRRWVGSTALDGSTDLNSIPSVAVDRIEVLTGSAAALYGSGAIGGVINIVMRDGIDGFEANAYAGAFSQGDGERRAYDLLMGHNGDRFSAMLALGYVDEQPVIAGDRRISREPLYGAPLLNSSGTTPNGRFALCPGGYDTWNLLGCRSQTSFDGTPGTFTYDGAGSAPRRYSYAADHYNQTEDNHLLSPQERHSALASASFDFTHWLRLRTDVSYNRRQSEQLRAALPLALGTAPGAGQLARQVYISRDSVYNPFGQDVSYITRRLSEGGGFRNSQDVRTQAVNVALESNFMVGDRAFAISAGYSHASNRNETTVEGLVNYIALRDALGPSFRDADGVARCGTPTAVIANCVPLNLLGAGSATPEMLAYVGHTAHEEMEIRQHSRHVAFSGDLIQLPGGPLRFTLGYERRNEYGHSTPDAGVNTGNTNGSPRTATTGDVHSEDTWLELAVPLLADLPFAKRLDIDVAARRSKYGSFGETVNGKFGFRWQPMDDLTVRGDWSEGFRAPSINELFQGQSVAFMGLSDPCNSVNFPQLSAQAQQRCVAQGVPVGGYVQDFPYIFATVGGNAHLKSETSTSTNLGLDYRPSWAEGLELSLDWWRVRLEDTVRSGSANQVVQDCIRNGSPAMCDRISRDQAGYLHSLEVTNYNFGSSQVEGYDFAVGYRLPETSLGRFSLAWHSSYIDRQVHDLDGDGRFGEDIYAIPRIGEALNGNEGGNTVGQYGAGMSGSNNWRLRSTLGTRWELGQFGATWNVRYYSSQEEDCQAFEDYGYGHLCSDTGRTRAVAVDSNRNGVWDGVGGGDTIINRAQAQHHIGATTYHDVSAFWNAPWKARITIGANNVFDKDPPIARQAAANSFDPQYDVPGRFVYLRYSQTF